MRTLKQPGEDLDRPSLRACPRPGCVAAPESAGQFPASFPMAKVPGFTMSWLAGLRTGLCTGGPWSSFVFCFLSMLPPVPYCPLQLGNRRILSSRPGEWRASLLQGCSGLLKWQIRRGPRTLG